jgi:hypothetical protein
MKYLKPIFESQDKELELILDTFISISDAFGEPLHGYREDPDDPYFLDWVIFTKTEQTFGLYCGDKNADDRDFAKLENHLKYMNDKTNLLLSLKHDLLSARGRLADKYEVSAAFFHAEPGPGEVGEVGNYNYYLQVKVSKK